MTEKKILVVDDITDTGESMIVSIDFLKSLNPKEKEGMKRMIAVGMGGTGLAMAIAYNPEAMPLAFLPTSGYIQRERIKSALRKLHIIHEKDKLGKVV